MKYVSDLNKHPLTGLGNWLKSSLCAGLVLGLSLTAGTAIAAMNDKGGDSGLAPFARIAKIPVVKLEDGSIDYLATYKKAMKVSEVIGMYIANVNDATASGFPANWIVGGLELAEGETATTEQVNASILRIPSPELIDPNNPALGIKKANVMDLCNSYYAKQALGVAPIAGTTKKVVNGYSHAPALPCELSTWNDDEHIYVDMLDPNAIFTLFFTDVLVSADMQDPAFAAAISALPPAVKSEIMTAVYNALDGADIQYKAVDQMLGPKYKDMNEVFEVVATSPNVSPYKHVAYTRPDDADGNEVAFTTAQSRAIADKIIEAMSIHGTPTAGTQDPSIVISSPKASWRSARHDPLGLPGKPSKNWVIEACSPYYAKMAMSTGLHHVTALPCEIAVQIVDRDGNGTTESLVISYLDPAFMLNALFADITDEEKAAFGDIPAAIISDLQNITQFALDNSGIEMNTGVQFYYNMLP